MRRSLASQYRVKTAHHLLNILALNREIDTYNVNGLLKAASVGQSKEACLRYAGLHAALLIEKRAIDFNNLFKAADGETPIPRGGYNSPYFGGSSPYPERPEVGRIKKPGGLYEGLAGMGNSISNAASSVGKAISNYGMDSYTPEMRKKIYGTPGLRTEAPAPKIRGGGLATYPQTPGVSGSLRQQPAPTAPAGSLQYNPADGETPIPRGGYNSPYFGGSSPYNAPDPVRDAQIAASKPAPSLYDTYKDTDAKGDQGNPAVTAANAVAATPATPTPASVIPKPAATGGVDPFAANSAAYAKAKGAAKPAKPARVAKPVKPVNPDTFNDITGKTTPTTTPQQRAFGQKALNVASGVGDFVSNAGRTAANAVNGVTNAMAKATPPVATPQQTAFGQKATNIASGVGNFMSNFGKTTANAANAMGGATPPSTGGYAASQSGYGASPAAAPAPAQSDYDSQIGESQRYSDASKQQGDEDAYMKSIEPTAPTYRASPPAEPAPAAQEEVAQESQPQAPQGRGTPILDRFEAKRPRGIIGRIRGNQ